MKKIFGLMLAVMVAFSACSTEQDDDQGSSETSSLSASSQTGPDYINEESSAAESVDSSSSDSKLLMKTFGELWMGDAYYIDVAMTQEYDPSKFKSSAASESSDGTVKVVYDYIIAVDFENDQAGVVMMSDVGNQCCVYKDHEVYTIDHRSKTYTHSAYDGIAENFGEEYTVKRCLGIINNCTFVESGTAKFNNTDVKYEKYNLTSQLSGASDPVLTYYFDYSDTPVAEVLETDTGKTTFEFHRISQSIEAKDILAVPSDYKDVTE